MSELKPCPFCGSSQVEAFEQYGEDDDYQASWIVRCHGCDAQTAQFVGKLEWKRNAAIKAWNKRVEG